MLIHRAPVIARFTRSDATRLGVAAAILILVMTAILGADILPEETFQYQAADVARSDIVAPRPAAFDSKVLTDEARAAARDDVPPQYTYNTDAAIAIAATGATNPRDMGKVMGWLSPRIRGRADGKIVSGLVASTLAQADLAAHDGSPH